MNEIFLARTGQRPLKFLGELVAEIAPRTRESKRPDKRREHWLRLYKTQAGQYVVAVEYYSDWPEEVPRVDADVCDSAEAVAEYLESFNPLMPVVGFPPGTQFEAKQARLLKSIRSGFADQITDLLAHFPGFGEEVD